MEYGIRKMRDDDTEQAAALESICFSQPWTKQGFIDGIKQEQNLFLAAFLPNPFAETLNDRPKEAEASMLGLREIQMCEEQLIGYVGMYVAGDEGEITNVAVDPSMRRQGVAKALLNRLIMDGIAQGISRIVLEVRVSNESAILLYEGTGFQRVGVRKGFYERPREDALIMVWEKETC